MEIRIYGGFETARFLNSFILSSQKRSTQDQLLPGLGVTGDS